MAINYDKVSKQLDEEKKREDFPPAWNHKEAGNKIAGKILVLEFDRPTTSGVSDTIHIMEIDGQGQDGKETFNEKKTVFMSEVLRKEVQRMNFAVGDNIGIKALGKPKGKNYYNYNVIRV